jgi:hypothetical protein
MRTVYLIIVITILNNNLAAQLKAIYKEKETTDTVQVIFNGLNGQPIRPVSHVLFKSWITIILKNVNPYHDSLSAIIKKVNFEDGVFHAFNGIPADEKSSSQSTEEDKKVTIAGKESLFKSTEKELILSNMMSEFRSESLWLEKKKEDVSNYEKQIKELQQRILVKDENILKLDNKIKYAEGQITKKNNEIKNLQRKISKLEEKIKLLQNETDWENQFKKEYRKFKDFYSQLEAINRLPKDLKELFKPAFIDSEFAKDATWQILQAAGIVEKKQTTDIVLKAKSSIILCIDTLINTQNTLQLLYNKINEGKLTESLDVSGALKNEKEKQVINVKKLEIVIPREPRFKNQIEFMNKKVESLKKDSIREVLINNATYTAIAIEQILKNDFSKSVANFQLNTDEAEIEIPHKLIKPFSILAKGRFKVELSNGLFAHIRGTDDEYTEFKDSIGSYLVSKPKTGAITSWGPMIHFYRYQPHRAISWGGSIGLHFPINNENNGIQFTGAGTIRFNTIDKLAFSLGVSFRKIQKLNTGNLSKEIDKDGQQFFRFKSKTDQISYDKVYKPGLFVGISYNFATLVGKDKSPQMIK